MCPFSKATSFCLYLVEFAVLKLFLSPSLRYSVLLRMNNEEFLSIEGFKNNKTNKRTDSSTTVPNSQLTDCLGK